MVEAAEGIGIGRDTLSDLERGRRRPVMPTLKRIAEFYGVPVEDLLEEPALSGKDRAAEGAEPKPPGEHPLDELLARLKQHGLLEARALSGRGEAPKEERTIDERVLDAALRTLREFPSLMANAWARKVGRGRFFSEEAFREATGILMTYETAYRWGLGTVADLEDLPDADRKDIQAVQAGMEEWKCRLRDAYRMLRERAIAERDADKSVRLEEYAKFLKRRAGADLPSTPPGERETG